MWTSTWREQTWQRLGQERWDVLIIGGGITGAGVLRLAAASGLKALLVEGADFSYGTSSRSSKLVHGGLRYLFNRQFDVTRESVHERQWMLRAAPGLVTPLAFVLPNYERFHFPGSVLGLGVFIYDLMGRTFSNRAISAGQILNTHPDLAREGLKGGFRYYDAQVDDSRLVLRVLREACAAGGTALNYARAETLLRDRAGRVCGAAVRDTSSADGGAVEVRAGVVINATGPWTDEVRGQIGAPGRLRRLRGSHLVFSRQRFPLNEAITLFHPRDRRALFLLPWEGATMIGTTDIDHDPALDRQVREPFASADEIGYMLEAAHFLFPDFNLGEADILSTFSGLRPVVRSNAATPSKESRAHALWQEEGLITITGGKLTTFRIMASQTVQAALAALGRQPGRAARPVMFDPLPALAESGLDAADQAYLLGRYGAETPALLAAAAPGELAHIDSLPNLLAELRWAARSEGVAHLDDLLLRRVRLGLLLPQGGQALMAQIRAIAQPELGWDDARWQEEETAYRRIWQQAYSPAPGPQAGQ